MNDCLFRMSIADSVKVCKECSLLKDSRDESNPFSVTMPEINDLDTYCRYVENLQTHAAYDILLNDDSMFQFAKCDKPRPDNPRKKYEYLKYVYVQCPYQIMAYEDFCREIGIDVEEEGYNEEYNREIYENGCDRKPIQFPFYLRYDVDLKGYHPNSHSFAHLHIGFREGYRMPVSLILTPKAFVCMVIKLVYSQEWKDHILADSRIRTHTYESLKSQCNNNKNPHWAEMEKLDLYIG